MMKFLNKNTIKVKYSSAKMERLKGMAQILKDSTAFVIGDSFLVGLTDVNGNVELFIRSVWGKRVEFNLKDVPLMAATMSIAKAECDAYEKKEIEWDNRYIIDNDDNNIDDEPARKEVSIKHLMPGVQVFALRDDDMISLHNLGSNQHISIELAFVEGMVWAMGQLTNIKDKA